MRVLVTGATGNVGTALLRRLAREDVEVAGLARRVPPPGSPAARGVRWHAVDLTSANAPGLLREALRDVDAVVHAAWLIQPAHDQELLARANVAGTAAVVAAAAEVGVGQVAVLSSVGTYAPGPTTADGTKIPVTEDHPVTGLPTSWYSRQKAAVEASLDEVEREHPDLVITRIRPALVVQADAGPAISRYFIGPFVPLRAALRAARALPFLPLPRQIQVPVVHADDLADAIWRALQHRLRGGLNVSAEPPLGPDELARAFGAGRAVPLPLPVLRALAAATFRARLQPTDQGWVDIGAFTPLQDTTRARTELGWAPQVSAQAALADLLAGMAAGRGGPTPPLRPRGALHGRVEH
jgi:nucleoside-diphosphate-sugar epimerase